jgi:hypothetical protein
MAEIRYGWREGSGKGKEYTCAADQYFHRRGGKFVYLNDGHVTLCATNHTQIMGWAETPKDAAGYNSWKSSAGDKVFVMYDQDAVFELPADESVASLCATWLGAKGVGITMANATYTLTQKACTGRTTASPLTVVDYDSTNKTVFVKIKPSHRQAI